MPRLTRRFRNAGFARAPSSGRRTRRKAPVARPPLLEGGRTDAARVVEAGEGRGRAATVEGVRSAVEHARQISPLQLVAHLMKAVSLNLPETCWPDGATQLHCALELLASVELDAQFGDLGGVAVRPPVRARRVPLLRPLDPQGGCCMGAISPLSVRLHGRVAGATLRRRGG